MKKLRLFLSCEKIVAITYLGISALAIAEPVGSNVRYADCRHPEHIEERAFMPPPGLPPFLYGLKLTEEQNNKVFALTYPEILKKHERMKQKMQLIKSAQALSSGDKLEENQVTAIAEKLALIEKDEFISNITMENKMFQLLTPEQRSQVLKNQQDHDTPRMMPLRNIKNQPHYQSNI